MRGASKDLQGQLIPRRTQLAFKWFAGGYRSRWGDGPRHFQQSKDVTINFSHKWNFPVCTFKHFVSHQLHCPRINENLDKMKESFIYSTGLTTTPKPHPVSSPVLPVFQTKIKLKWLAQRSLKRTRWNQYHSPQLIWYERKASWVEQNTHDWSSPSGLSNFTLIVLVSPPSVIS